MKVDLDTKPSRRLAMIKPGDVFRHMNVVYMRIHVLGKLIDVANCVSLGGHLALIEPSTLVEPIDGTFVQDH